jgi:branched-chain amino acid transport system substrate-binding protein
VIVDAIKRTNSVDHAKVLASMPATNYSGVIGLISFDLKGDLKKSEITIYEFKDKKRQVSDVLEL